MLWRILLAGVFSTLLLPGVALAKRIALPSAEGAGKGDGAVSAKVIKVLKQHKIQVVAPAQVSKATRKNGIPGGEDGWIALARKLKVDGFVQLTFSTAGTKRTLDVAIRNGADGSLVEQPSFTAKGAPKGLATVVGASLWKKIAPALGKTAAPKKEADGSNGMPAQRLPPASGPEAAAPKSDETDATPSPPADSEKHVAKEPVEESPNGAGPEEKSEPAEAAPRAVKKQAPQKDETAGNEEEGDKHQGTAPLALDIELDARLLQRTFSYVPSTAADGHQLNFVPVAGVRANWFPAAHSGRGWASNLGLRASFEFATWLKTAGVYPTGTSDIVVGPQLRIPFSAGQVSFSAAFFRHVFVATDSANDPPRVSLSWPNTVYIGTRIGAGARLNLGWSFLLGLDAGYRLVTYQGTAAGQVKSPDYFPDSKVSYAGDGMAYLGFRLGSMLEARAGADYRYYRLTSLQGPAIQADAAVDQYVVITVGLAGVIGGK